MGVSIEVNGLTKSFGSSRIWEDVTLEIPSGEVSVLLGPSGTGKSVFLKSLIGLLRPERGSIIIDGTDIIECSAKELYEIRTLFGVLFQDGALFGSMNLFDNTAFPLREHTKKKEKEVRDIVMEKLTMVGLGGDEKKFPGEISGGMRKRAGLARALVLDPQIILCDEPDSGDILVHGESVPNMSDDELFEMRKKFGLLFQDGALFGSMNIWDNTAFPLRQHTDKSEEEIGEIVNKRLQEVGLAEATEKMPNELSGGMRKRAGFARALVLDPAIVFFDEPDSGLDPVRTALLCELIREIHEENKGCYMVISHDLGTARRIADFIAVLWKGRIVESGPSEELFNSDNEFVSQFLNAEVTGPLAMD